MPIVVVNPVEPVPSTDSTSPDELIRARVLEDFAGVHITVDYTSLFSDPGLSFPNPFRATVFRRDKDNNTVIVRGGNLREQGGGKFYLYDDEVSFGQTYTYYAEAYTADGQLIRRSYGAAVLTWAPPGGESVPGVWVKSLEAPALSSPVRVKDWGQWTFASRNSSADLLNSKYSAITFRPRDAGTSSMQVLTRNQEEYESFASLASNGVVFIASLNRAWQRDGYYLFEDISPQRPTEFSSDFDYWSVALRRVDRPQTLNQNYPSVPWGDYADAKQLLSTYATAKSYYATYKDQTLDGTL